MWYGDNANTPPLVPICPVQVIDFFLRTKSDLDYNNNPSMEDLTGVCHALTSVRALLLGGLNRYGDNLLVSVMEWHLLLPCIWGWVKWHCWPSADDRGCRMTHQSWRQHLGGVMP